jgi:hypothetical protein
LKKMAIGLQTQLVLWKEMDLLLHRIYYNWYTPYWFLLSW